MKQKIQGASENTYICVTIQIKGQKEFSDSIICT